MENLLWNSPWGKTSYGKTFCEESSCRIARQKVTKPHGLNNDVFAFFFFLKCGCLAVMMDIMGSIVEYIVMIRDFVPKTMQIWIHEYCVYKCL